MESDPPLTSDILVDDSVEYHSGKFGVNFFGFDEWASNNVVPGCDRTAKIDLIATPVQSGAMTWFIEVKDFRVLTHAPNRNNTTDLGTKLEKKIEGTFQILFDPKCLPCVTRLYPGKKTTNFLFHYEMPLKEEQSAYFPEGYPVDAIQQLRQQKDIRSRFNAIITANAEIMNASERFPWHITLNENRRAGTAS
ncbi:MAG: hypothetical protein ACI4OS_03175 [Akkermansia sp.]